MQKGIRALAGVKVAAVCDYAVMRNHQRIVSHSNTVEIRAGAVEIVKEARLNTESLFSPPRE